MNVYAYQAALYCDNCGETIRHRLNIEGKKPNLVDDEHTYDSDDYPKGPYPNGGGESDSPNHCGGCDILLENPLTSYGEQYVKDAVLANGRCAVDEWRDFYSYLFD